MITVIIFLYKNLLWAVSLKPHLYSYFPCLSFIPALKIFFLFSLLQAPSSILFSLHLFTSCPRYKTPHLPFAHLCIFFSLENPSSPHPILWSTHSHTDTILINLSVYQDVCFLKLILIPSSILPNVPLPFHSHNSLLLQGLCPSW